MSCLVAVPGLSVQLSPHIACSNCPGFELDSLDKVPDSDSHPGRGGMEYMAVWTRT